MAPSKNMSTSYVVIGLIASIVIAIVLVIVLQPVVGPIVACLVLVAGALRAKRRDIRFSRGLWVLAAITAAMAVFIIMFEVPVSSHGGGLGPISSHGEASHPALGAPAKTTGP